MRYSRLFPKSSKQFSQEAILASHRLLSQAGYIKESVAGRYYLLPLGLRVQQKIQQIIKEEMDKAGYQELLTPILHPISLWKETKRTASVGFELMTVHDRNNSEFVLGGTAEEMLVDLVRKYQISYKDLPINLYQFSTKFRDELRAKGGLLRLREFVMKDAYSFAANEEDFIKEYKQMWQTYLKIFERLGLLVTVIESDNGYIGGEYCHEFVVPQESGESRYFISADGSYAAHEDVAKIRLENKNIDEPEKPLEKVDATRGSTMEDGAKFHNLPLWRELKNVLFVDENGRFILAVIRGDLDVNETKLTHVSKVYLLRHATDEEIIDLVRSFPGFISPVGIKNGLDKDLKMIIVADESLYTVKNAYSGANEKDKDYLNINMNRDFKADVIGDIAAAFEGATAPSGAGVLTAKKGIEVGNIFQLGFYYSKKMTDATFFDKEGKPQPYYMGCYGIGLARTMATVVEEHHDQNGIIWPESIAPYRVHLIGLDLNDKEILSRAEKIYDSLCAQGIEVLFDDRVGVSAGEKFSNADLIGIPVRAVISKRTEDKLEIKKRDQKQTQFIPLKEIFKYL